MKKLEKLKLSKLNWMYDDVPFENNEQVEENSSGFIESSLEFTEGKSKVENMLNGNNNMVSRNRDRGDHSDRINKIIGVGMSKPQKTTSYSDDPLAKIKQQQQQQAQRSSRKPGDGDRHRHSHHKSRSSSDRSHKSGSSERSHKSHSRSRGHESKTPRQRDRSPTR